MNSISVSSNMNGTTLLNVNNAVTKYTWIIKNLSGCFKVSDRTTIESPIIPIKMNHNLCHNYQLILDFGQEKTNIKLKPMTNSDKCYKNMCVNLEIGGPRPRCRNRFITLDHMTMSANDIFNCRSYYDYMESSSQELTIKCEISIGLKVDFVNIEGVHSNLEAAKALSIESTLNNLRKVLNSAKFSDVTLIVRGRRFSAHKAILASRSPVFSAMFDHEMLENKMHTVEISDVKQEIMAEVLKFIYTGDVINIKESTSDLLYAAVKYQLDDLRLMCEEVFIEKLRASELEEILKIVDKYETCRRLRDAVFKYLSSNRQKLSDDFGRFEKTLSPSFFDKATKAMST